MTKTTVGVHPYPYFANATGNVAPKIADVECQADKQELNNAHPTPRLSPAGITGDGEHRGDRYSRDDD